MKSRTPNQIRIMKTIKISKYFQKTSPPQKTKRKVINRQTLDRVTIYNSSTQDEISLLEKSQKRKRDGKR